MSFRDAVKPRVDEWLARNAAMVQSWEGEFLREEYEQGHCNSWLPTYNHGVYFIGLVHPDCPEHEECDGRAYGPDAYVTCYPYIKIGRASDMTSRIAGIRSASPYEMDILALMPVPNPLDVERVMHNIFGPYRVVNRRRSEWFWNSEPLSDLMEEVYGYGGEATCR